MHLDFASALSLVSTVTLIGALVFTGLQVRAANRARREQAAVTAIQTTALSENSARILELLGQIPENATATAIDDLDAEAKRQIFQFGLRLETGEAEFLEWCEWLAMRIAQYRATRPYVPAYARPAN